MPEDARDRQALEDAAQLMLWRAYLGLLQGLYAAYRVAPDPEADPASEQSWLQALVDFNPQMAELLRIQQARADRDHWLCPLRLWWQQYWSDPPDKTRAAEPMLIDTDTAGDWADEARTGLAEWAEDLARNSQTN